MQHMNGFDSISHYKYHRSFALLHEKRFIDPVHEANVG